MGDAVSCVVSVRHFLAPGAARDFDEAFRRHHALVSARDGFISLRRLTPTTPGHENEVVLMLEFATIEGLVAWRATEDHAGVSARYRSLWARDPVVEFFSTQE
jgi:heme-degrading monooxygenase HmoA